MKRTGTKLKERREALGLSRHAVALEAGLSYATAMRVEENASTIRAADAYAAALERLAKRMKRKAKTETRNDGGAA